LGVKVAREEVEAVEAVLSSSFDPIVDDFTGADLLPVMLASGVFHECDYSQMHSMLLRRDGVPVGAALLRAFGAQLAEVPLIATAVDVRRQVAPHLTRSPA
jgi:hypothetical protein